MITYCAHHSLLIQKLCEKTMNFQIVFLSSVSVTLSLWYLQTIRFPHQNDYSLEVCTCVCRIQEESPAHLSGLQIGNYSSIFLLWVALFCFSLG